MSGDEHSTDESVATPPEEQQTPGTQGPPPAPVEPGSDEDRPLTRRELEAWYADRVSREGVAGAGAPATAPVEVATAPATPAAPAPAKKDKGEARAEKSAETTAGGPVADERPFGSKTWFDRKKGGKKNDAHGQQGGTQG